MSYSQALLSAIALISVIFLLAAPSASAQCPAYGYDTTCGVVITISTNGGGAAHASLSFSGQGPYEGADDTLVGVVNNTTVPLRSLDLTSANNIFGFDGDGIDTYGAPGNSMDTTGYGGPDTYFTNISADTTSGTAVFVTPVPPNGGTTYFSLENSLAAATICSAIINNSVPKPSGGATTIMTTFTPNYGYSLASAASLCGFTDWDWQQTITLWPMPSSLVEFGNPTPLHAPPPFNDPPKNGYIYFMPAPSVSPLPLYYNPFTGGTDSRFWLINHETATSLSFFDGPGEPCLPGGASNTKYCAGKNSPPGSKLAFTTHLVGLIGAGPGYGIQDTGIGFSWTSTYNYSTGNIAVSLSNQAPPSGGTGSVAITAYSPTTSYIYPKSFGVTGINGAPVVTPPNTPTSTLLGQGVVTTEASGLAYSRLTQSFGGTVTITNVGKTTLSGPFQVVLDSLTPGVTLENATGSFGGWSYVSVPGVGSLAPGKSASVSLEFKDSGNAVINFSPVPYSGSFN